MEIKMKNGSVIEHNGPIIIEKYITKLYTNQQLLEADSWKTKMPNSMIASIELVKLSNHENMEG